MHTKFTKNLAKLMVCTIAIPSVYTNATLIYEQEGITYIENNIDIQTTTGPAIEIKPVETIENEVEHSIIEEEVKIEIPELPIFQTVTDEDSSLEEVTMERVLGVAPLTEWDGANMVEPRFENNTYYITSADEMAWLENEVNNNSLDTTGVTLQLQNDIDFNNHSIVIGTVTNPFKGDFDGNGYSITNLDFTDAYNAQLESIGLFAYAEGGNFGNVELNITIGYTNPSYHILYCGGLIGYAKNIKILENIKSKYIINVNGIFHTGLFGSIVGCLESQSSISINNVDVEINTISNIESYGTRVNGVMGKFMTSSSSTEILIEDVKVALYADSSFKVYPGFSGVIGMMDTPNMQQGTLNINNLEVGIYCKDFYVAGSLTGVTEELSNFTNININNYIMDLDIDTSSTLSNYKSALFGRISANKGNKGNICITNSIIQGSTGKTMITGFIHDLYADSVDIMFKSCIRDIDTCIDNTSGYGSGGALIANSDNNKIIVSDCINNSDIKANGGVGGLLGSINCKSITVENCINRGDIESNVTAGGIIGNLGCSNVYISNCENYGSSNGRSLTQGGGIIAGLGSSPSTNGNELILEDCINYGNFSNRITWGGGLIGNVGANESVLVINRCKNFGEIAASYSGGLVGWCTSNLKIKDSVSKGKLFNNKDSYSTFMGGLVGACYAEDIGSGINYIQNCEIDILDESIGSYKTGGLIGYLDIAGEFYIGDNTVKNISAEISDNSFGGLIGHLNGNYKSNNDRVTITNNTLDNINVKSTVNPDLRDSRRASGLLGIVKDINTLEVENNTLKDISISSNDKYASLLIGEASKYSDDLDVNLIIRNNLLKGSLNTESEGADLIGSLDGNVEFGGNIAIINGKYSTNGVYELIGNSQITQSLPNYFVEDISEVITNSIFKSIKEEQLKNMNTFQGLDFENVWGYVDDNIEHPVLGVQTYSISSNEDVNLCVDSTEVAEVIASHPALLNSIEVEIEDENIATIEHGVIIPKAAGTTRIIYRTNNLPLSEQLECVQELTVGDYSTSLELKGLVINPGEAIPSLDKFVESFKLWHPFDNQLDKEVMDTATYQIVGINNSKGEELTELDTTVSGTYTLTIEAKEGNYSAINSTKLRVKTPLQLDDVDDKEWFVPETKPVIEEVQEERVTVSFKVGRDRWYINGELMHQVMDQAPELKENRAYVPLRFLSYALQVDEDNIKWDNHSKTVKIVDRDNKIELAIGSNIAILNGQPFEMDGVPYLSNGRVMLPISQIQGVFKSREPIVAWDQEDKRVDITLTLSNYTAQ